MSALSRFMCTAREILNERGNGVAKPKQQPPFFVRTTWMFAELEDLSTSGEAAIFKGIKIARLDGDVPQVGRLVDQLNKNTDAMEPCRRRHERRQLASWIIEQINREKQNAS